MPGGYKKIGPNDGSRWKKGQSGNPKGRPKKIPEIDELLADVLGDEQGGISAAKAILLAVRAKALKGDTRSAEILMDRAWGKPKQQIDAKLEIEEQVFKIGDQEIKFK